MVTLYPPVDTPFWIARERRTIIAWKARIPISAMIAHQTVGQIFACTILGLESPLGAYRYVPKRNGIPSEKSLGTPQPEVVTSIRNRFLEDCLEAKNP
jgi:hypothetical protein